MQDKKFDEYLRKFDLQKLNIFDRSIIYKYLNKNEKAKQDFKELSNSLSYKSRYGDNFKEENKINLRLLNTISSNQIRAAIFLTLSNDNTELIKQHFHWASDNSYISNEDIPMYLEYNADVVAEAHLWRGYALLMLGNYEEACRLLKNVIPFFNKSGYVYQKIEYALPKALVPLCDYNLQSNKENRIKSINGLEDYIKSIKDPGSRLWGYLYYFHLKESFPNVYNVSDGKVKNKNVSADIPIIAKSIPTLEHDIKGKIGVLDLGDARLELIGNKMEFDEYIDKVAKLGCYPAITQLMETYILSVEQEPGPLVKECKELLSTSGLESDVGRITELILNVAEGAKDHNSNIRVYYDKEDE